MSSRPSCNRSSALLSILFGWLFLAGLVSPLLHGSIPRDRHPTVELPALIEGPPAAERVASAFPPARLELGLSEGDAAILRRVLVRQNPWTKFDPEGLNDTFGWHNPVADYLAPDPVGSYNESGRQLGIALDPDASGLERAGGLAGYVGHGMSCLLDCIPGVGNLKRGAVKKIGEKIAEHAGEKIVKEGAQAVAKHADEAAGATTKTARGQVAENAKVVEPEAIPSGGKPDFVVTTDGTAIPVSQTQMREGFDNAGFPKMPATKTAESGVIHTVPGKDGLMDVRTMDGSSHHPKRAVFTDAGTNNPVTPSGAKFRSNETKQERRRDSHVEQKD